MCTNRCRSDYPLEAASMLLSSLSSRYANELQDLVMASSHFLRDGGGCCSAVIATWGQWWTHHRTIQNWLIEEFVCMVRCEHQCMNLEENRTGHALYTLLHCPLKIPAGVFLKCLTRYRSWALLEASICVRGLSANGIQSGTNNPTNSNIQQDFVYLTAAKGSLPEQWHRIDCKVFNGLIFMLNVWLASGNGSDN